MATRGLELRNSNVLKQQMANVLQTIGQGPSHRPLGKGASYVFEAQPEAKTPGICKQPFNGSAGFKVSRYSAENPFNPVQRAPGVNPLSNPDLSAHEGNLGDAYPVHKPIWDTPLSYAMDILNHANAQPVRRIKDEFQRSQGFGVSMPGELQQTFDDFAEAQASAKKDDAIRTAIKNGFSKEEATAAYKALRADEAKAQMFTDRDANTRLNDMLDSRFGGTQDGAVRSNDESALFLAQRAGNHNYTAGHGDEPLGGAEVAAPLRRPRGRPTNAEKALRNQMNGVLSSSSRSSSPNPKALARTPRTRG
jgi:hypothetical protein